MDKRKTNKLKIFSTLALALPIVALVGCSTVDDSDITIKFESNYGFDIEDVVIDSSSESAELPTLTRVGYEFLGWYLDADFETPCTDITELTNDSVLYANWNYTGVYASSETTLLAAIESNAEYVMLTADIELTSSLIITNDIIIDGENDEGNYTIYGDENSASTNLSINIQSGDVTLKNLNIKEFGSQGSSAIAVMIGVGIDDLYTDYTIIDNCNISEFGKGGIVIYGSGTLEVTDSTIDATDVRLTTTALRTTNGIQASYGATLIATNNTIKDSLSNNDTWSASAILAFTGSSIEASGNTFDSCQIGISLDSYWDPYFSWTGDVATIVNEDTIYNDNTFINMDDEENTWKIYSNSISSNIVYFNTDLYYSFVDDETNIIYTAQSNYTSSITNCVTSFEELFAIENIDDVTTIYVTADAKETVVAYLESYEGDALDSIEIIYLD